MRNTKLTIVGLLSTLSVLLVACDQTPDLNKSSTETQEYEISQNELTLRQDMRELWSDHAIWTRSYIVAAISNTGDAEAAANRLLENQEHMGNAVATYYGTEAGNQLTTLLKEHITIAVDLIEAGKNNDQNKFNEFDAKWKQNGQEIADFLASANPNWPQQDLRDMMAMHLETTTNEVEARLNNDYEGDVRTFDEVYDHLLKMADTLSDGIIKQFPDKF